MDEIRRSTPLVITRAGDDGDSEVVAFVGEDGEPAIPTFTDIDALRAWDPDAEGWAALSGASLCGLAVERGVTRVVFNPAGPHAGSLREPDISLLADADAVEATGRSGALTELRVTDAGAMQLLLPGEAPPPELQQLLRSALADSTGIARAHLLVARYPERAQWMLLLEPAAGVDGEAALESVGAALRERLAPSDSLDLMLADDRWRERLAGHEALWSAAG